MAWDKHGRGIKLDSWWKVMGICMKSVAAGSAHAEAARRFVWLVSLNDYCVNLDHRIIHKPP